MFFILFLYKNSYRKYSKTDFVLGTIAKIIINNNQESKDYLDKCFLEIKRIENKFSVFNKQSEIYKINNRKQNTIKISDELVSLLKRSIKISKETNGAFDITVLPLIEFWKQHQKINILPQQSEIYQILKKIGYGKIFFLRSEKGHNLIKIPYGFKIDLGGIAKGYAIKRCAEILEKNNIENFLINIGGDIYAKGYNLYKKQWKVGIENPNKPGTVLKSFKIKDKAVFTSGGYHRFFTIQGKKYSHIINPKTGWSVSSNTGVTLTGNDPVYLDGIATAVSIMPSEELEKFLKNKDIKVYAF